MPALTTDQILTRANNLARQAAAAQVPDEQLSLALVHLKRHRDVAATLTLLAELRRSSFAHRSRSTPAQFQALEENVQRALQDLSDWEEAAAILGWARRLVGFYAHGQSRAHRGQPSWR
jgi:hypothetical protein